MKYTCKTKCFFQDRLYNVGEVLEVSKEVKVPEHFSTSFVVKKKVVEEEPKTLKELGEKEAMAVLNKKKKK